MARNLPPRTPQAYTTKVHGHRESQCPPGVRVLNPAVPGWNLVMPSYNDGPTIFRPWGPLDFANPKLIVPGRNGVAANDLSHWSVRTRVAKFVGLPGGEHSTWNLYHPVDYENDPGVHTRNPYVILYKACQGAFKTGDFRGGGEWDKRWNRLMLGGDKEGASISAPNASAYIQGFVYASGDKNYLGKGRTKPLGGEPSDGTPVVCISGSTYELLMKLYAEEKSDEQIAKQYPEGFNEDEEPWKRFKFGDPTGIYDDVTKTVKSGAFVAVFNSRKAQVIEGKGGKEDIVITGGQNLPLSHTSWDGQEAEFQGYDVALFRNYISPNRAKYNVDLDAEATEQIKEKFQFPFDDPGSDAKGLILFLSVEEQCLVIARAFAGVPDLVRFAWADNEEFMTPEVQAILNARRMAVRPGTPEEKQAGSSGTSRKPRLDPTQRNHEAAGADDGFDANPAQARGRVSKPRGRRPAAPPDDPDQMDMFEEPVGGVASQGAEEAAAEVEADDFGADALEGTGEIEAEQPADGEDAFGDDMVAEADAAADDVAEPAAEFEDDAPVGEEPVVADDDFGTEPAGEAEADPEPEPETQEVEGTGDLEDTEGAATAPGFGSAAQNVDARLAQSTAATRAAAIKAGAKPPAPLKAPGKTTAKKPAPEPEVEEPAPASPTAVAAQRSAKRTSTPVPPTVPKPAATTVAPAAAKPVATKPVAAKPPAAKPATKPKA